MFFILFGGILHRNSDLTFLKITIYCKPNECTLKKTRNMVWFVWTCGLQDSDFVFVFTFKSCSKRHRQPLQARAPLCFHQASRCQLLVLNPPGLCVFPSSAMFAIVAVMLLCGIRTGSSRTPVEQPDMVNYTQNFMNSQKKSTISDPLFTASVSFSC